MEPTELIARYDRRVPRYTSYPTALQFNDAVGAPTYSAWLAALPGKAALSLYVHVPFCRSLCLFCGCHTTAIRLAEPAVSYAKTLLAEIDLVAAAIGRRLPVAQIHWGGGTPTHLPAEWMRAVNSRLREHFAFGTETTVAVELDPRTITDQTLRVLSDIGTTRASIGVQDLDPRVQIAVNRVQPFGLIASGFRGLRQIGVRSISVDLMYGLPLQTTRSVTDTLQQILSLAPDRVAVFGYAHVPWMKRHQKLIAESALPQTRDRWAQRNTADSILRKVGYVPIGLDHYAREGDALAVACRTSGLHRNFQGYTTDNAPALIGLGASAIGSLPQGYVQNASSVPDWRAAIGSGILGTARGCVLSKDDSLRRDIIEQIMCNLGADLDAVAARHDANPAPLRRAIDELAAPIADGLACWDGRCLTVTELGRPFIRTIAAAFDAYHRPAESRHAPAI